MSREDRARFDVASSLQHSAWIHLREGRPKKALECYQLAAAVAPEGPGRDELRAMAGEMAFGLLPVARMTKH